MLDRLISISGREYDREIIKYGLIAMGNGVLSVLIILMCGVIEKRVFESFIYLFCNLVIYTKIGGYHARTPLGCTVLTIVTWKIAVFCNQVWLNAQPVFWILACEIYIILVWRNAPVLHPNKARFGEVITQRQKLETISRLLLGYVLIIVFWSIHRQDYASIFMMSISEIIISMLVGKEVYKRYAEKEIG